MKGPSGRVATLLVFTGVAVVYLATFQLRPTTDAALNSFQTRALVLHGDVDLRRYVEAGTIRDLALAIELDDGRVHSIYGVGISLTAAPLYAVLARLDVSEAALQGSMALLFAAAAAAALFALLRRLFGSAVALGGATAFAFGTTMWPVATTALWQHAPVAFFVVLGASALFSEHRLAPLAAGAAFGWAGFVRSPVLPIAAGVLLYVLWSRRSAAWLFLAGAAVPLLGILVQNRWIWGSWLSGGYVRAPFGFDADPGEALWGQWLGPWRGLLVYSPFVVVSVAGAVGVVRDRGHVARPLLFLGAGALAVLVLYSRWTEWWGGASQYGYRFPLDVMPILVLLGAFGVARSRRLAMAGGGLGIVSVAIMAAGMLPDRRGWDHVRFPQGVGSAPIGRAARAATEQPGGFAARLLAAIIVVALLGWVTGRGERAG